MLAKGRDAKGDVFFERNTEFLGATANVVAIDAAREGFVFETAFYGIDLEVEDAFGRADVSAGGKKAGEFVAGEEYVFQRRLARHIAIVGVRENGADNFAGVAVLAENLSAMSWMFFIGGMSFVRPALVIEIVEKGGKAPGLFIGALLAGIGANAGFDGEHVFTKRFRLRVFAKQIPGVIACRHRASEKAKDSRRPGKLMENVG